MCNIRAAFSWGKNCKKKKCAVMDNNELWGQMYAIQSPSLSVELSGKDAEKMLGWSDTCCWSWTGPWWQSTSYCHSQQEEGKRSVPTAIKPKWKANIQGVQERETKV